MSQRPIEPNDLFRLQFLQAAELSPDNRWICVVVSSYNQESDADHHQLWLYSADGGTPRQLTHSASVNSSPTWSPDSKTIAFISNRQLDGKPQIYLLPVDGGEARSLTNLPQGVAGPIAWSPTGEWIACSANTQAQSERDPSDPYRITRQVYRFDAIGYLDHQVQDLTIVSVETGEAKQLTDDAYHNNSPRWSPDGSRILYSAQMGPDTACAYFPRLCITDLEGNQSVVVDSEWGDPTG